MSKYLNLACLLLCLLVFPAAHAQETVADDALTGKQVLFVIGQTPKGAPNDDPLIADWLKTQGAQVTLASVTDPASRASGKDLVVISSTINARELGNKYRDIPVPLVTWSAYSFPLLGMTGDTLHEDFTVLREKQFHNANHAAYYAFATSADNPIIHAAKMTPGMFAPLLFSGGVTDPGWGKPGLGAEIAATFDDDRNQAAVFTYERNTRMIGEAIAPARRVGLFLGNNSWSILSDAQGPAATDPKAFAWFSGRRLFAAALRWAVSPPQTQVTATAAEQRSALEHAARGKKVLYVRRYDLPWPANEAADAAHIAWLESLGFEVHTADQLEPDTRAQGMDLIVISASINKYKLGLKYADAPLPVMMLEAKAVDAFGMIGRRRNIDYGVNDHKESHYPPEAHINLLRASHPLAAGFPAGQLKLFKTPGVMSWSRPPAGAQIIASTPNQPEHANFFVYEKGATMAHDAIAPARRVLFPMDANRFPDLTEDGLRLYGAAMLWLLN